MDTTNQTTFLVLCLTALIIACDVTEKNKDTVPVENQLDVTFHESRIGIDSARISKGQLLFVATYSGVQWTKGQSEMVGSNLSIRNTSQTHSIKLMYVDFYDGHGSVHENYVSSEIEIAPMGSEIFHIHQHDEKGGTGSNFLVEWESDVPVSPPYVENVSFRMSGAQSFAFASPAIVLRDRGLK